MKNSLTFLSELRLKNGSAWVENGTLKFSIPKEFQNEETKEFIKENKPQLITILEENNVSSKEVFLSKKILKDRGKNRSILSFSQQRLWFIESFEGGTNAYHIPWVLELSDTTEKELFEEAIQAVVKRHEILRSVIVQGDDNQWQQELREAPLSIDNYRCERSDYSAQLQSDINRPFDLKEEYPIRVCFYEILEGTKVGDRHVLILMHHIASDGWSIEIFARELDAYYNGYKSGTSNFELPELTIQYSDYAVWERTALTGNSLSEKLSYWETRLAEYQPLSLPTDFTRPSQQDYKGNSLEFIIPKQLSVQLRALTLSQGASLYSVLLSSVAILLGKYCNQEDILIGSPHVNRDHHQTSGLIGFFVNTLVNRVLLDKEQSFAELIRSVHQDQITSQAHQDFPFEKLIDHLSIERDPSRHPLFQIMFSLQSFGQKEVTTLSEYVKPIVVENNDSIEKFDLSITMDDSSKEIAVQFSYAMNLFEDETIERLAQHYLILLEKLLLDTGNSYLDHSLLNSSEHQKIVYDWNSGAKAYPKQETIVSIFESQVENTPDQVALVFEGKELTYRKLNELSNRLAQEIRKVYEHQTGQVLGSGTLITLCLDRSLEMVIGILGVLKAGGAYVPIDPEYPQERIDFILEDTHSRIVLTQENIQNDQLSHLPREQSLLIDLEQSFYKDNTPKNPVVSLQPEELCYVIYTSGTTGKPKGVMVEHTQVISFVKDNNFIDYEEVTTIGGLSNYAFDGSVFDIFFSILNGKKLVMIDAFSSLDSGKLDAISEKYAIDTIFMTTVLFNRLVLSKRRELSRFKQVLFGGESCNARSIETFKNSGYTNTKLIHVYGPTETIVYATYCRLDNYDTTNHIPIGNHLNGKKLYVLDNFKNPVPVGVVGELYIGGVGISRGYLNREELTADRFINDPFGTKEDVVNGNTRIYKTGDLVRWLPDGNIEYIGRNDDQVKVRGYRIELAEIEAALLAISGIEQSCVLARERNTDSAVSNYLVGYYVLSDINNTTISSDDLIEELSKSLPEYMIPSAFVAMKALPLTVNGKLDKQALPDPEFRVSKSYVAPETELEKSLCDIWASVLGVERVGITDHFFRIGGNSILAMQLTHQINDQQSIGIKVSDLFKSPTIKQLLANTKGKRSLEIPKLSTSVSPLSFSQQRLWFIESYEEGTNAYHMPSVLKLLGNVDIIQFEAAIQSVLKRHEVLRSVIAQGDDHQWQQVVNQAPLPIHHYQCQQSEFRSKLQFDMDRPFDLQKEYPIRICFYEVINKEGESDQYVLILMHHIASDGWSMDIFARELDIFYNAYVQGDITFELPLLPIQYSDYAIWERASLTGEVLSAKLSYWESRLSGYQALSLPTDYPRPAEFDYVGDSLEFIIPERLSAQLRKLNKNQGVTLHSTLLSSVAILLGKYSNQEDILIGSPHANRDHYQTGGLIGFFVNSLINRVILNDKQSFIELIEDVHQDQITSQEHQDFPFEQLLDHLSIERDPSRHPLFQVMFEVQTFGQKEETSLSEYIQPVDLEDGNPIEKFDLSITMSDNNKEIGVHLSYSTSLFKRETIEGMAQHYLVLLEGLVMEPAIPYLSHSLLDAQSYQKTVFDWNATEIDRSKIETIVSMFESQVEKTPNHIALVYQDQQLSYKELNERSNQLARHLLKLGVTSGDLVGICIGRSCEMVIGVLGVLKTGAAYVPIDPEYPQDRIDFILEDTASSFVLTQEKVAKDQLSNVIQDKKVSIDLFQPFYDEYETENLATSIKPGDLCYVIYTSGTTGRPKGVMIEHNNLANIASCWREKYNLNEETKLLQMASFSFDVFTGDLCRTLLFGGGLIICPLSELLTPDGIYELISHHEITILESTPGLIVPLMDYIYTKKLACQSLKLLILGSDTCQIGDFKRLQDRFGNQMRILNSYGLTETTIDCSFYEVVDPIELDKSANIPIGKPLSNYQIYILDKFRNPLPVGVIGEMYIGGAGVARGYLNREDLTQERFFTNPFVARANIINGHSSMYKTGDLARWLPDGNLEYVGRNDDQVKIRGYRIETAEIEAALSTIGGVAKCHVLAKERITDSGMNKYLVGYYSLSVAHTSISTEVLIQELLKSLPEYMIPSAFVQIDQFPMTVNGKLDKRALPEPDFSVTENYVAPQTALEIALCEIWASTLGLEQVGITDHFFRIGGNSILAMQLVHRINEQQSLGLKVSDLFKSPTIEKLLALGLHKGVVEIPKLSQDISPLSFSQQRLWFIESYEGGTNAYHMPVVLQLLEGTDVSKFEAAIQSIIQRHQVLRSVIVKGKDQRWTQVVNEAPLNINQHRCNQSEYRAKVQSDINRPFDLEKEYPIRICFYEISENGKVNDRNVLILMHHIASDGWSIDVFARELDAYNKAYQVGDMDFELPELPIQYSDYAVWEKSALTGTSLSKKLSYWESRLSGYQSLLLPTDYTRPTQLDYKGSSFEFVIPEHLSNQSRELAQTCGVTLHSMLLSSVAILLSKYSDQEDLLIGSPHSNRDHYQTGGLIGFFTNTLVNRVLLNKEQSFIDLIQNVHEDHVNSQVHQDFPFEQLINHLSIERDPSRHPLVQVMFEVQSSGQKEESTLSEYIRPIDLEEGFKIEKFDLSIYMDDSQPKIAVQMNYATSLFAEETIRRMAQQYLVLLERLVKNEQSAYQSHSLLDTINYQTIVYDWNATDAAYPEQDTIVSLFESQVDKNPNQTAVIFDGEELSYQELNDRSNRLAHYLQNTYNLESDDIVGIMLDRSLWSIISIFGILKAGAAYAPIDPGYPEDRKSFIVQDTGLKALIIESQSLFDVTDYNVPIFSIDVEFDGLSKDEVYTSNPEFSVSPNDLCYVIYTSGTTGKPKGVMVEHTQISSFAINNNFIDYNAIKTVGGISNYAFDGSVFDIFFSLLNGKSLVMIDIMSALKSGELDAISEKFSIDTVFMTTVLFNRLVFNGKKELNRFKQVLFGGESCNLEAIETFKNGSYDDTNLIHVYGPTETIVYATFCRLDNYDTSKYCPIGRKLSDKKLYVLDNFGKPVPIGVIGELYIGGASVSRGYLNREDLTVERFVENPFITDEDRKKGHTRMYKTGDLVRWLADGNLEYIGRNDTQVKIRGFRIELSEIEAVLSSIDGISECAVLARERSSDNGTGKYLVGYYIAPDTDQKVTSEYLIEELSKSLPDYMIPSVFVAMETLPMTSNGKLDKTAMPEPEFNSSEDYVAPKTEGEISLCEIWVSVLGIEQVGITDHFFKIGGNSILAIQLVHQINERLSIGIKVSDLFKFPTIKQLLEYTTKEESVEIPKLSERITPLSFSQQRLWFIESFEGGTNAYHIPLVLEILEETDSSIFEAAIQAVVQRHQVLRSVIQQGSEGQWQQAVQQDSVAITHHQCNRSEYNAQLQSDMDRPFDLEKEYPIRICFYQVADQQAENN
ncbi:non-ribosomal peptide synthetase, partial [uncultured Aquimarina sp.]|uniref:non-ribosomal peptide synthetase n=1 Tax=uncultured Aquimarina sp. TaxID=575652 RepID=UPI002623056F